MTWFRRRICGGVATKHSWGEWKVLPGAIPTYQDQQRVCERCGFTERVGVDPMFRHTFRRYLR